MTTPTQLSRSVSLDDLIAAITKTHDDPLSRVTGAAVMADHLGELSDHLLGHFVDQARRSGATWADIGSSIGVTRQAVQKRFASAPPQRQPESDVSQGFARFADEARNVVVASQNEAQARGHQQIEPGHLLLGMLAVTDSVGAAVLRTLGHSPEVLTRQVEQALPAADEQASPDLVPFDERAKTALLSTVQHADRLSAGPVSSGHILLGVAGLDGPVAPGLDLPAADIESALAPS